MKKFKNLFVFILMFLGLFGGSNLLNVKAETNAPSKITMKSKSSLYYYTERKGTDYISGYNFYRKELTDGTLGYCVSNINTQVPAGMTLSLKGEVDDKGLDYIIKNGYPNKSFTGDAGRDYYITQSAIWAYYDETKGSNNWKSTSFDSSSTGMKKYVYTLVKGAENANKAASLKSSISISTKSKDMTLSNNRKYFVSNVINTSMVNTKDTYTVNLENAPKGTIVKTTTGETKTKFSKGEGFVVYVPVSSIDVGKGTVIISVSTTGLLYKTYRYTSGNSSYQDISPVKIFEETTDITSKKLTLKYEKQTTKVRISKQDITSKEELPGAKLTIKDKNNKVVASWTSTNKPHYIEGLPEGSYTLTETKAPKGYVLSTETIKFTLIANGIESKVVMYNTKEKEKTKYKISKQDITSKEELPGATLIIKDKNGKEIESWVSTNEPHYVKNLAEGEYTLTEKIAPKGYELSSETIKFTVQKDGKVKTVVMYNAKEKTKIKISKQDITTKKELPGATLIIKDKNGKEIESWVSTNEPHYVKNLAEGEYTLTEKIAPKGYALSTETIKFTVQRDGKVKTVVMYNAKETEKTKYLISKQDITTKEELPGATLIIKDKNGKEIEKWVSTNEPHYVKNLAEGEYTLTEKIAPKGYVLSTETIKFTVQKDGKVKTVVMYNTKEIVTKVKISKQDITTKEELPGATLIIKDKNGKEVASWVSTNEPHYIEKLSAGEYTLTEKIAPEGYELSSETISFVVKADGSVTSVVMYNTRETKITKVKISKQDITTKEELPGATLIIKDKNGKEIESWVSESTPHYIEGLEPGEYTLTETTAPKGYKLSSETINFVVKVDGSITSVVMYNDRYTEVPITDLNVSTSTIIGAVLLILMGTGMVFYAKRSY